MLCMQMEEFVHSIPPPSCSETTAGIYRFTLLTHPFLFSRRKEKVLVVPYLLFVALPTYPSCSSFLRTGLVEGTFCLCDIPLQHTIAYYHHYTYSCASPAFLLPFVDLCLFMLHSFGPVHSAFCQIPPPLAPSMPFRLYTTSFIPLPILFHDI